MMVTLLLSIFIPLSIGFLLSHLLWPAKLPLKSHFLIKLSLSVGLGFGISSCIFFVWLLAFGPSNNGFIVVETALLIFLIGIFLYRAKVKRRFPSESGSKPFPKPKFYSPLLSIAFFVAFFSSIAVFICLSLKDPHGQWDAWAIWNMRARFIFRGGERWTDAFFISWSHTDYPLLLPGIVARSWKYIGYETTLVPILISMLFTFAIVGLVVSSLFVLRSKMQGFLAGLVILSIPFFIMQGASQYADIPLGFYFLASIALFYLKERFTGDNFGILLLAGMTAGFAAWTKNEGLLFLALIIAAHLFITITTKGFKGYLNEMFPLIAGLVPILAVVFYFKIRFAPPNDIFSAQGITPIVEKLTDFSRYLVIGRAFFKQLFLVGNVFVGLLVLYLFLLGTKIIQKDKAAIFFSFIAMSLMFLGYFSIYIITPYDLVSHLNTSLGRLLLQLLPSSIFIYFIVVSTPE